MPFISKFPNCTCVAFDLLCDERLNEKPCFLSDFKNYVVETLKTLGFSKISIVAHSFGARIALLMASENEVQVEKMFLVGPAGIKPKFSIKKFFKIKAYQLLKFFSKIGLYSKEKLQNWGSSDYKTLSPVMKKTFQNVIHESLTGVLKNVSAETLVVIGENDRETPVYMGKILKKKIKNCSFKIISGAGHFCFLEKSEPSFLAYYFLK